MSRQRQNQSRQWQQRQAKDPYVRQARSEGPRSRAVFKLRELQQQDHIIKRGMTVVELGCAPGGWTQELTAWVGEKGQVMAVDLLVMAPIPGARIVQGDFTDPEIQATLLADSEGCDAVVSDMAPNLSGHRARDQWQMMGLFEALYCLVEDHLHPGGNLVCKLFHGEGFDDAIRLLRQRFATVKVRKPQASRQDSRECYVVAKGWQR